MKNIQKSLIFHQGFSIFISWVFERSGFFVHWDQKILKQAVSAKMRAAELLYKFKKL